MEPHFFLIQSVSLISLSDPKSIGIPEPPILPQLTPRHRHEEVTGRKLGGWVGNVLAAESLGHPCLLRGCLTMAHLIMGIHVTLMEGNRLL